MEPTRREFIAGLALAGVVPAIKSEETKPKIVQPENSDNLPEIVFQEGVTLAGVSFSTLMNVRELWDLSNLVPNHNHTRFILAWLNRRNMIRSKANYLFYGMCYVELLSYKLPNIYWGINATDKSIMCGILANSSGDSRYDT